MPTTQLPTAELPSTALDAAAASDKVKSALGKLPLYFIENRGQIAHRFHKALLEELASGKNAYLGDAILAAQKRYAEEGSFLELIGIFHLFGDSSDAAQVGRPLACTKTDAFIST